MIRSGVILLVEDNEDDLDLALRALEKSKVARTILVARDGEEAVNCLLSRRATEDPSMFPEVVLLDLKLPKLDGIEVLRRIRADERTKLLPVVLLTSSIEDVDRLAGYLNGANTYVRKPVDFLEFSEIVHQLGLYWLSLNQPPPLAGGM